MVSINKFHDLYSEPYLTMVSTFSYKVKSLKHTRLATSACSLLVCQAPWLAWARATSRMPARARAKETWRRLNLVVVGLDGRVVVLVGTVMQVEEEGLQIQIVTIAIIVLGS